jgi:Domain of unknown function (DUF4385)
MPFDYSLDFQSTDFRLHPQLYRVGVGEQGVLLVQPYKSEILPLWRFKTPQIATQSSERIYSKFLDYLKDGDFVGADMARKFLQMGYTRARRYANHKSGQKYASATSLQENIDRQTQVKAKPYPYSSGSKNKPVSGNASILTPEADRFTNQKALSANIFYDKWQQAKNHPHYIQLKADHISKYGK